MVSRVFLLVCVALAAFAAPLGAFAAEEVKKPKVSELMKKANELMTEAQTVYVEGDSKKAIGLYRQALGEIDTIEREHPAEVASSEFAPVRFRRALCETEIDRIMLEDVNATSRTVAVTDTTALELKRAERKLAAESNKVAEAAVKLGAKPGAKGGGEGAEPEPVAEEKKPEETKAPAGKPAEAKTEPAGKNPAGEEKAAPAEQPAEKPAEKSEKPAPPVEKSADAPVNVKEELEWAKDMLSVERFSDVERALLKVLKQAPENRDARFLMALAKVQQGLFEEAVVVIDDLLDDATKDESVLLLASGAYAALGQYAKAMDLLDKAMKANPKRPEGYHDMAWLLLEMKPKDTSEAEMYYRQAVKLGGPRDRDLERRLGIRAE